MDQARLDRELRDWKRILAITEDNKPAVFVQVVHGIVGLVAKGLERAVAVDTLRELLVSHNLDHLPELTDEIDRQFERLDRGDFKGNGQAKPAPLKVLSNEEFVGGFVPPDYLVDGLLQRAFVYCLTGVTGHAKSAIALLLAELVGANGAQRYLGNYRVEHGRVVYFVGENPDDIRMRVIGAHSQRTDNPMADDILWIPGIFDIAGMFAKLQANLTVGGGVSLVIVDTSAAYFLGNEEMSNTQMGQHARMLRRLTELPGRPCVLVLCHPIKHASEPAHLLPRGGGAFLAEVDGNLTAWKREDGLVQLHHNKIRGPGFEPMSFRLETIRTDRLVDAKGRQIPTVRAVWVTQSEEDTQEASIRQEDDRTLAARLYFGDEQPPSMTQLGEWVSEKYGIPVSKWHVQRSLDRLVRAKLMNNERGQYFLTEKGKTVARKAAARLDQNGPDA